MRGVGEKTGKRMEDGEIVGMELGGMKCEEEEEEKKRQVMGRLKRNRLNKKWKRRWNRKEMRTTHRCEKQEGNGMRTVRVELEDEGGEEGRGDGKKMEAKRRKGKIELKRAKRQEREGGGSGEG